MLDGRNVTVSDQKKQPLAGTPEPDLGVTAKILVQVRDGDAKAREKLIARYLPMLCRWAHGRLPRYARDMADTDDVVQVTLMRALKNIDEFESQRAGAFLAYLRRIVLNAVRDEIRRSVRRPNKVALSEELPMKSASLLEQAIGREAVEAYEAALTSLPEEKQEAVILRIEFGMSYPEIAESMGLPSANSARMMVARSLVRLAEILDEHR